MISDTLALNPEFEKLKREVQERRGEYAQLLEDYTVLTGITGPRLENEYMQKIGKKEHRLFTCRLEIMRLRREISLYQAAANRGECITPEAVEETLNQEFQEYHRMLEEHLTKVEEAELYLPGRLMSEKDAQKRKKLYHKIVRKLHPDLNPDLPPKAMALWMQVQHAYAAGNVKELELLNDMVDEMLEGKSDYIQSLTSMEMLREELEKLEKRSEELKRQLETITEKAPFTYGKVLENPDSVREKRRELDEEIRLCTAHIEELKEIKSRFGV